MCVFLDNPIWAALRTRQAHFAVGDMARRYPAAVAPFLAVGEAGASIADLAEPGETLYVVGVIPSLDGWEVEDGAFISQMVCERPGRGGDGTVLGVADVPDMLELIALAYPGYFRERTIEMGTYFGVRHEGKLVAMAGQRLCLDGYREISGVCTHPDHRGRGYASRLIARLVEETRQEGLTPFLHVNSDNAGARAAYEKAGFVRRCDLPIHRIRRLQGRSNPSRNPRQRGVDLPGSGCKNINRPRF